MGVIPKTEHIPAVSRVSDGHCTAVFKVLVVGCPLDASPKGALRVLHPARIWIVLLRANKLGTELKKFREFLVVEIIVIGKLKWILIISRKPQTVRAHRKSRTTTCARAHQPIVS